MRRTWRWTIILLVLVAVLLPAGTALAGTAVDVAVLVKPKWSPGILNFSITYVNDTELDFTWSCGVNVTGVMLRGKYSGWPTDIPNKNTAPSDGYLVYYGSGTSCNDTSMDFDQNPGPIYYKIWAQMGDGTWRTFPHTGSEESKVMTMLLLGALALGLTIAAFFLRHIIVYPAIAATFAWLVFAGASWVKQTGTSDPYFYLFLFALAMTITMPVAAWELWKQGKEEAIDYEEERQFKHKERSTPRDDGLNAADRLRIKHGMGRSMIRQRRDNDTRNGW